MDQNPFMCTLWGSYPPKGNPQSPCRKLKLSDKYVVQQFLWKTFSTLFPGLFALITKKTDQLGSRKTSSLTSRQSGTSAKWNQGSQMEEPLRRIKKLELFWICHWGSVDPTSHDMAFYFKRAGTGAPKEEADECRNGTEKQARAPTSAVQKALPHQLFQVSVYNQHGM